MAAESRKQVSLLVGLSAALALVLWWQLGGSPSPASRAAAKAAPRAGGPATAGSTTAELFAQGVALPRLSEDRPAPQEGGRDPFRTGAAPATAAGGGAGPSAARPAGPATPPPALPSGPILPPGPPPPPPIAVKFIGVVSRRDIGKVAVLSDGKNVYYGREGEIVDGRWRIVAIGEESLQIEYADGRGRQTVRLSG